MEDVGWCGDMIEVEVLVFFVVCLVYGFFIIFLGMMGVDELFIGG